MTGPVKTATAETAAHIFVASKMCIPDMLIADRDTCFPSAFWTGLHEALGVLLIFGSPGSPCHHNTTSKAERVNGIIAVVRRRRADGWPALMPLVDFAIYNSASPIRTGYVPFYADCSQHPRHTVTPPQQPTERGLATHKKSKIIAICAHIAVTYNRELYEMKLATYTSPSHLFMAEPREKLWETGDESG